MQIGDRMWWCASRVCVLAISENCCRILVYSLGGRPYRTVVNCEQLRSKKCEDHAF